MFSQLASTAWRRVNMRARSGFAELLRRLDEPRQFGKAHEITIAGQVLDQLIE
jgi:hypothetical protein